MNEGPLFLIDIDLEVLRFHGELIVKGTNLKSIIKGDNWSDEHPYETMHRFHP